MSLKTDLESLRNLLNYPRFYLSNYFNDIRNEADVAFIKKDLDETDPDFKRKIKENWLEIIEKIDSFEKECIQMLAGNSFSKQIQNETNELIEKIENKLNENKSVDLNEINGLIYDQVQKLERILFQNKFMVFLLRTQCLYTKSICESMDFHTTVGKLVIITNEYLGRLSTYNLKKK